MASFPIYRDVELSAESKVTTTASSPPFKIPSAKAAPGKEQRARMLQNSGQKQPSSWHSGNSGSSSFVNPALRGKAQQSEVHSSGSIRGVAVKGEPSSKPSTSLSGRSLNQPRLHGESERRKKLLASIEELLNQHPEEFAHIPTVGKEPDQFEEAASWAYHEDRMMEDFAKTMDHFDSDWGGDLSDSEEEMSGYQDTA